MPTCHGNTKSGSRCKRSIVEGQRFCSTHADQASDEPEAAEAAESCCESIFESDQLDALLALAVGGLVIVTALVFRRVIKIFYGSGRASHVFYVFLVA